MARIPVGLVCAIVIGAGCASAGARPTIETTTFARELGVNISDFRKLSSGEYIRDMTVGTGIEAAREMTIQFRYILFLPDGQFMSGSLSQTEAPLTLKVAVPGMIRGWYDGIPGMRVGGRRQIIVPADLGYGRRAKGNIPPNSILVFEVELVNAY
jgi:FKBP-type peptidyl-prolyl cis-trans isomerase